MATPQQIATPDQMDVLLRIARESAEIALGVRSVSGGEAVEVPGRFGGAFVTVWSGSNLRGCVGTFASTGNIAETVAEVACKSLEDSRFASNPVTADELPSLDIEVSLLSDAVRTADPSSLIPGVHGVVIRRGLKSGCFLPKVATERGWSAEEFLANCCTMKAGISADAWRSADTEVSLFTAQVFSEKRRV
jgi:AmmeMemoRadiSam system protein A